MTLVLGLRSVLPHYYHGLLAMGCDRATYPSRRSGKSLGAIL